MCLTMSCGLILSQHLPVLAAVAATAAVRSPVSAITRYLPRGSHSTPLRLAQTRVDKTTACRVVGVKKHACVMTFIHAPKGSSSNHLTWWLEIRELIKNHCHILTPSLSFSHQCCSWAKWLEPTPWPQTIYTLSMKSDQQWVCVFCLSACQQ